MPRRKRNHRNRRRIYKQQSGNGESIQNTTPTTSLQETPPTEDVNETFLTLPNIVTPIRTPSTPVHQKFNISKKRSNSIVRTTPTSNLRKLLDESSANRTPNTSKRRTTPIKKDSTATNLSKLFEQSQVNQSGECLNNVTPKCSRNIRHRSPFTESYINNLNRHVSSMDAVRNQIGRCTKIRSNSSMSKLRSPGLDKIPIMVDVATQTVYFDNSLEKSDIYLRSCINIFETPKINQMEKLEKVFNLNTPPFRLDSNIKEDANLLNSNKPDTNVNNKAKGENLKYLENFNEIIYPPTYNSPKILQKDNRDNDSELSFFSSQLKTVSTPIDKLQKTDRILENMAKNVLTARLDRKLQANFSPKTPNNPNFNTNTYEDKAYKHKLENCISKRRMYNSVSPPKRLKDISEKYNNGRNNSMTRVQMLRNDSDFVPKTFSPARGSFNRSNNILNVSNSNMYARFMTNIKKLHSRYSTRWFNVIKDVCCGLGISIKQKLSGMCPPRQDAEKVENEPDEISTVKERNCYNCRVYVEQITSLSTKVDNLNEEIGKMKEGLYELDVMKKKIKDIEEKLDNRLTHVAPPLGPSPPPPPPPPLPPPPPPLPLPTMVSCPAVARHAKTTNSKKIDKKNCENSRPVISLNDILNVKLKKTSDQPILARRSTQPLVSVEMLNQVKLRPPSRQETLSIGNDVSTPTSLSSSPINSLTKLLSNVDPTVRRLKRLRRVGHYSLDDSRKHLLRRERFGGEDSS